MSRHRMCSSFNYFELIESVRLMKMKYSGERLPDRSASRILALSLMNQALHSNHNGRRLIIQGQRSYSPTPPQSLNSIYTSCNSIQGKY